MGGCGLFVGFFCGFVFFVEGCGKIRFFVGKIRIFCAFGGMLFAAVAKAGGRRVGDDAEQGEDAEDSACKARQLALQLAGVKIDAAQAQRLLQKQQHRRDE